MTEDTNRFVPCGLCGELIDLDSVFWWYSDEGPAHPACVVNKSKYYCREHRVFWLDLPLEDDCEDCKPVIITAKLREEFLKNIEEEK